MAAPSSWRWSCESHLTLSSVSRIQSGRPRPIRVSLEESSRSPLSSSKHNGPKAEINQWDQSSSSREVKGSRKSPRVSDWFLCGDESKIEDVCRSKPQSRVVSRVSLRKGPQWKRIFLASKKVRSIILLNVLTVIYASDIPVIKEVEQIIDPALFTAVRFAVSAVPFLPAVLKARGDCKTRAAGMELGFWVSLGYLTQTLGLLTSDAGRASFISAFTVIAVPLIDGMLGANVPALTWFGAIVSLIGVGLLESSGSPPTVGDILNIMSAVFFGVHMLRTEHISRTTNKEKYLALLGYEVFVIAGFSVMWYVLMSAFGDAQDLGIGSWSWATILERMASFPWIPALYTGILSTGVCLWLEIAAMCDVSATEAAIIYGLEPLWGAAFAWCLLGERWGTSGWIGAALVLGGSMAVQILGSASETSTETVKSDQSNQSQVSERGRDLSTSPIPISSRDDITKLLK